MNVLRPRSRDAPKSSSPPVSATPLDPLTHAFLSKRTASSASSYSANTVLPGIRMMSHSPALRSGDYGSARPAPTPPSAASSGVSSTELISQSDERRVNATHGSAHALLALIKEAKRQTHTQKEVMKHETRQHDDAALSSNASTTSSGDGEPLSSSKRIKRAEYESDSDAMEGSATRGKKGLKRKFRKATHTVRKEEKEKLLYELEQLQLQMDELKRRALEGGGSTQTRQHKNLTNAVLRDTLQQQLGSFADAQVLFSEYGMTQVISPISLPICLGRDRSDRMATLAAIKERKIELSRAFLRRRIGSLDPCKPYCEDQRFETPNGDYCAVRLSILQFEGVQSVKQVLDIMHYYFSNIEISISEKIGSITIREDDDMHDKGISQNRLVGTMSQNQLLESNTIMFSEYIEHAPECGDREYGIVSAEFVDQDELYPYRPEQRLRKDINAILQLTSYTQIVRNAFDEDVEELVVVFTRWSHSRLHKPEFPVPTSAMHEMRENMERWGESMHRTMREMLYPDA